MDVAARYDALAPKYDESARRMSWLGFREEEIHAEARAMLDVLPGERVAVIGGGTGQDVVPIAQSVGDGTVWNVDISQNMLDVCRTKCAEAKVDVEHVHADAADWSWPLVDAVICNFTLQFQPRWSEVIHHAAEALAPGGRMVIAELELPWGLRHAALPLISKFGHTRQTLARRPGRYVHEHWNVEAEKRFFFGMGRMIRAAPSKSATGWE